MRFLKVHYVMYLTVNSQLLMCLDQEITGVYNVLNFNPLILKI